MVDIDSEQLEGYLGRRRRTSSLFEPNDYGITVKEMQGEASMKGRYSQTHCHDPQGGKEQEFNDLEDTRSNTAIVKLRRVVQNTYQMQPKKFFDQTEVAGIVQQELQVFCDLEYKAKQCTALALEVSDRIRQRIQKLQYERYKFVVHVTVGGKGRSQGVQVSSRCIWDASTDNYASASVANATLFATGNVYALYCE